MLRYASAYNVDPYALAAVGWHETHWGTLGAGRPSSGSYIFGYGVPLGSARQTQYTGTEMQIKMLSKRLAQWQAFLGHAPSSLSDWNKFAAGAPGSPLGWQPAGNGGPPAWAQSVYDKQRELAGGTSAATSGTAPATTAPATAEGFFTSWLGVSATAIGLSFAALVVIGAGMGMIALAAVDNETGGRVAGIGVKKLVTSGAA